MADTLDDVQIEKFIDLFNNNAKEGVNFIASVISEANRVKVLAQMFRVQKDNLDLTAIGDFLGSDTDMSRKVLAAFVEQMDFKDKSFISAMREYLQAFKLPGEAQKIDRLIEGFAKKYVTDNPDKGLFEYSAPILGYQAVMLNTDLHNPNIPKSKKMTLLELKRNLRGTNLENKGAAAKNFDDKFVEDFYHDIKSQKFKVFEAQKEPAYTIIHGKLKQDDRFKQLKTCKIGQELDGIFSGLPSGCKITQIDISRETKGMPSMTNRKLTVSDNNGKEVAVVWVYQAPIIARIAKVSRIGKYIFKPEHLIDSITISAKCPHTENNQIKGINPNQTGLTLGAQIAAQFTHSACALTACSTHIKNTMSNFVQRFKSMFELQDKSARVLNRNTKNLQFSETKPQDSSEPLSPAPKPPQI